MSGAGGQARRLRPFGAPFVALAVAAGLLACWFYGLPTLPLESDAQAQFALAERVASGVPPHASAFNAKNALSFLVSGGAIRLARLLGASDLMAARAATAVAFALSVAATGLLTLCLTGSRLGAALASLCLLSFPGLAFKSAMGGEPKVFLVLFLLLAGLAAASRRPFWMGVAGAGAFLCWQPAGLVLAAAALVEARPPAGAEPPTSGLSAPRPVRVAPGRRLGLLALGAVVSLLAYEAYFALHGVLAEQLFQAYMFPARYMIGATEGASANRAGLLAAWSSGFGLAHPAPAFLLAWLAAFWWQLLRGRRGSSGGPGDSPTRLASRRASHGAPRPLVDSPGWRHLLLAAHGALAFTLFDHQGYPDWFFVLPFMAVATGWGGAALSDLARRRGNRLLAGALAGALAVALFGFALAGPRRFPHRFTLDEQLALAAEAGRLATKAKGLYSVHCGHLLALNRLDNWSPYANLFRGVREYLLARGGGRFELPAKDGRLPEVVLTSRRLPPELVANLERDFTPATPECFARQSVTVWLAREAAPRLASLLGEPAAGDGRPPAR